MGTVIHFPHTILKNIQQQGERILFEAVRILPRIQ